MKLQSPTKTLKVREFNELLSCSLCEGYLINPTTVDNCLHTYCRSCIVQHLLGEACCPQCKIAGGGKQINVTNLKSDDVLRALIFKLVPGLYQKERERALHFRATQHNGQQKTDDDEAVSIDSCEQDTIEENFFAPTEPISLSLEYHPALLEGCSTSQIPPVRYLQCPAGVKIRHLKRFLCSKFGIDPESKRIEVEVIYEDEVLPNDFTLMDVGYCYNWKRHAPMKFTYRILFYGDESQKIENDFNKSDVEVKRTDCSNSIKATETQQSKELTICDETNITTLPCATSPLSHNCSAQTTLENTDKGQSKSPKCVKVSTSIKSAVEEINAPVKMIIARKSSADSGKKASPKRNHNEEVTYTVTNDFKSLRSNDMRYSDYAVSSTTSNSNSPKSSPKSAQRSPKSADIAIAVEPTPSQGASVVPKCDIVVSIPQSQVPKSPYSIDDEFENVSLAQLKTASKKSPPSVTMIAASETSKSGTTRNVPKLKIELNSLKTRLSISKPKSAGVLHSGGSSEKSGRFKHRKHSLDDVTGPLNDQLDIETYAKNIGLQPIEVLTPPESAESCDKLKYSPNASPLSSASSTTSSSNNAFPMSAPTELASTSFHKKRKKKHSKDSKDPKDSKRRRMHAEISSKPEEESLKMKVKLTAPHNHKSHKSESYGTRRSNEEGRKSHHESRVSKDANAVATSGTTPTASQTDSLLALNKTLGEESRSINHLMKEKEKSKEIVKIVKADETLLSLPQSQLLTKPLNNIKEVKLPASPPLPPSLFKTTPLNFNTLTVTSTTAGQSKSTTSASKQSEVVKGKQSLSTATKPTAVPQYNRQGSAPVPKSHPHFIVPSLPRRSSPAANSSYTPSSIASASSKQLGMQLKRSASLDESYALGGRGKQPKLDASQRKSLYSSYANKPYTPSTTISITKMADTVTQAQGASAGSSAVTITARQPGGIAQRQQHWQLPPYTPLHLPYNKPAVEIVRINSGQAAADMQSQPTVKSTKGGGSRMMGPPLSMVKGKKAVGQQLGALPTTGATKSAQAALSTTPLGQGRNNPYRLSPPALVNLHGPTFPATKKGADKACNKQEGNGINNGATEKKLHQPQRISLREFRPNSRDQCIEIADTAGSAGGKEEIRLGDTTVNATLIAPSARESLEAALNKLKQNITSTTVQDSVAAAASKQQQQLNLPTDMSNDDLQNLHLLSESATAREKIAIRASQSYEKPKSQQSSLSRQQNASVRNIPNPSALAFRNMSTLPTASSTAVAVDSLTANSITNASTSTASSPSTSTATLNLTSPPAQKKLPLTALPLTGVAAPLSPAVMLHSTAATATATATPTSTTAAATTRTIKKPTTIDQVAANLNMRASAAAAEAYAAKLNAAEDVTQISSSTGITTTITTTSNNKSPSGITKSTSATNIASSTTANVPSAAEAAAELTNKEMKSWSRGGGGGVECAKAKVLPKSIADSGVVATAIVTDVASIKNAGNNKNNNNNNNSNSKNNNNNGNDKYGVTATSVASD
ncbi:protein suppressor 2 of zeste [Rhagoletis pomonella]|uniref:protein suppressor 2 of zeste n=1 Tax=Rhagoletis pomonella TaxID=28610 RepID=UPI001785B6EC|nr:protein suppressor 2 of zeste [Rhagoletis pomonella]